MEVLAGGKDFPKEAQLSKKSISLLAFLMVAGAMVYLVFIHHLFAVHPVLVGVQVGAVLLMFWARKTFGLRSFHAAAGPSEGGLVTSGPYRYWRHPIYASILHFVWAGEVHSPTVLSLVGAGAATAGLITRMLLEEQFLGAAYPEYGEYCKRAKRLIPFVV